MAFGDDGNLYVAVFGGRAVKTISPDGRVIGEIALEGNNPSNCAFGGGGRLLVTETEHGELLSIDIGVNGAKLFKR